MHVTVSLFARARELAGTDRVVLEIPPSGRVRDVKERLSLRFPQLAPLAPSLLVAVFDDYVCDDVLVPPCAEVACFPPVSGG
jgi:molybdopterin converting factor small subunit